MLTVLLQTLALASAGILSFGSITLVILLLISDKGWHNGLAYALGYTGAYTLIGLGVVNLGVQTGGSSAEPARWPAYLLIALGLLLLWLAWRNYRRPAAATAEPPRFLSVVDDITPWRAFGFGALVTVLNFKNLALFLSALSVVILSSLPLRQQLLVTLVAVLVFCLSVTLPVLIYLLFPRRARALLGRLKEALAQHNRPLGIWAPLLFSLLFIVRGITTLL